MASNEELFETSVLEVIAPPPSLEFPTDYSGEQATEWVSRMRAPSSDRKAAFFDENLDFFLTIRFPTPADDLESPDRPPRQLLSFLAHLQVSYETSYISPSANTPEMPSSARLSMPPPRNSSMQRNRPGTLMAGNPSMFPPHTPHPIPSAADADLKYVQSQGTPLVSAIWGQSNNSEQEDFALLWDGTERSWLAVYKMSILVLFMVTKVPDPLLCITVSTTLRNKPLAMTAPRKTLAALIDSAGGLKSPIDVTSPKPNGLGEERRGDESDDDEILAGLQEVNLLEGLTTGPTFNDPEKRLSVPTTRLGSNTRSHAFALPPPSAATVVSDTPTAYSSGVMSPPPAGGNLPRAATLRKSFRKTLKTHLGFRVRMRTVFVPYFLLPQNAQTGKVRKVRSAQDGGSTDSDSDLDEDILEEREQREAGNEEHTVVLSVEVENLFSGSPTSGDASYHFEIERIDVSISGTGARASFIGWNIDVPDVFPLQVGPREQVNLLYAVSFLRGPEVDEFSLARPYGSDKKGPADELQRAVTIHLIMRPYEPNEGIFIYPTHVFPSRWNCILDLASSSITKQQRRESADVGGDDEGEYFVMPTPASPFPSAPLAPPTARNHTLTPLTTRSVIPLTAVAGSKRHTIAAFESPANDWASRIPKSPMNYQSSTSMLNPNNQPPPPLHSSPTPTGLTSGQTLNIPNRASSYIPPSVAFQASFPRSPTTFDAPTSPPLPLPPVHPLASFAQHSQTDSVSTIGEVLDPPTPTPRTPAYPAYPSSPGPIPPTPFWQTPIAQQSGPGAVGPSVEIRRERGGAVPQTPGPTVGGFGAFTGINPLNGIQQTTPTIETAVREAAMGAGGRGAGEGEPIIVSVGLHPTPHNMARKNGSGKQAHAGEMYPLDQFTLDIFVFNQSSWTRRFEVSYPDERRRRRKARKEKGGKAEAGAPGIIPLENRVRIGPLLPSTCQSVRMDFLALAPGVHSIDVLTLTDVQSGMTMHLRNVIDIIVREPEGNSSLS